MGSRRTVEKEGEVSSRVALLLLFLWGSKVATLVSWKSCGRNSYAPLHLSAVHILVIVYVRSHDWNYGTESALALVTIPFIGTSWLCPDSGSLKFRLREQTYGHHAGRTGEEIVTEFGMNTCPLLYLKWTASTDLLYSRWNSAQCSVAAWMGGEFGGDGMRVYVWLSPFAVHLKPSRHC